MDQVNPTQPPFHRLQSGLCSVPSDPTPRPLQSKRWIGGLLFCRLAPLLQLSDPGNFEKSVTWLLTTTEMLLSCFTQAIDACQAAATLHALQQDYEQARHKYLQLLLDIAASLGEPSRPGVA